MLDLLSKYKLSYGDVLKLIYQPHTIITTDLVD